MAVLSNAELSKSLRQGELFPVYFLYGEETWQMEKCLAQLLKKNVDETLLLQPSAVRWQPRINC